MLRSIKELRGYTLHATDGEIGSVMTSYFDDRTWVIRYFVVETGNWLTHRRVLIAPVALGVPDWEKQAIPVLLTREQVKDSPSIDVSKPVSRQMEEDLHTHYGWLPYWGISTSPLESGGLAAAQMMFQQKQESKETEGESNHHEDTHLRSSREVIGYDLHAMDGDMGKIDDFIADDEMWNIRYLVVALGDTKRILSPHWVHKVNWTRQRVTVDLQKTAVQMAPEFDPETPVNREYEVKLYDYYGRPKYWSRI